MIVGGRVDVDDRAADRDLAAGLDLVLTAIPHRDEPCDQRVTVDLVAPADDDGLHFLHVGAEPLHERPDRSHDDRGRHARPEPPQDTGATRHRLERGRDALERQGLPRGKLLDVERRQELLQVAGEPLGFGTGRDRDQDRPAGGDAGETGHEDGPSGFGDRDRRRPRHHGAHRRLLTNERGEITERRPVGSVRSGRRFGHERATAPETLARPR